MSALLSEMISNYEEEYGESVLTIKARTELAKLRADLVAAQQRAETLQRERDEARAQLAELMATMAAYGEVEPPNGEPLIPRRCVTCAQEAAKLGWRVFRFTGGMVRDGRAFAMLSDVLLPF